MSNKLFLMCNISYYGLKIYDEILSEKVLKEAAFSIREVAGKGTAKQAFYYNNILIPIIENNDYLNFNNNISEELTNKITFRENVTILLNKYNKQLYNSIFDTILKLFENQLDFLYNAPVSIYITDIMDINYFSITYSDGSTNASTGKASFGLVKVGEYNENIYEATLYESFTQTSRGYETVSSIANNPKGTNSVGELSGVKSAIEHFDNKEIQIIISDNIYAIKAYREWIHDWEKNFYRNSTNKQIANKELIEETRKLVLNSNKLILYKWTKGHSTDQFNALADIMAKEAFSNDK